MTTRIPASLGWLLQKRARLLGEIKRGQKTLGQSDARLEAILEKFRAQQREHLSQFSLATCQLKLHLEQLQRDMENVDQVIRQYSDQIDPARIAAIKTSAARDVQYGSMTKQIRRILATASTPLTTSQIAAIASRNLGLPVEDMVNEDFREKIRYRLKAMASRGQILRHHIDDSSVKNGLEGCWSPAPLGSTSNYKFDP